VPERHLGLDQRQGSADADVRPAAEREWSGRATRKVEPVGILVAAWVAVGGTDEADDELSPPQRLPVQDEIGRDAPPGVLHGAVEAQQLAHRTRQSPGSSLHSPGRDSR
jgi:hypothetical protein